MTVSAEFIQEKFNSYSRESLLSSLIDGYSQAMLWASNDVDPVSGDEVSLEGYSISGETAAEIKDICSNFLDRFGTVIVLINYSIDSEYNFTSAGHDLFLTSARHGVGFWDRGFDKLGTMLTDYANSLKEPCPYIGDDSLVYM